jgi:hypothetical protein
LFASRTKHFFREEGGMPATAVLSIVRPREFAHITQCEFDALLDERVRQVEQNAASERALSRRSISGRASILSQKWNDRPKDREVRMGLNPRIAARSKWSRIEALLRNRAFKDAYLAARAEFVAGVRDVVFPAGTYWLRRFARAACAPSPAAV